jgi:hypothetical protein
MGRKIILKWILKVGYMGMHWFNVAQNKAKLDLRLVITCVDEKAPLNRIMYYVNLREQDTVAWLHVSLVRRAVLDPLRKQIINSLAV